MPIQKRGTSFSSPQALQLQPPGVATGDLHPQKYLQNPLEFGFRFPDPFSRSALPDRHVP
jgi:hypothetical protein